MADHSHYPYSVVDVFTRQPLQGNPLAVFHDASGLQGETMQQIARELNLSETVFLLPPTRSDCVARLRIFTPTREMVFAGHPTVGGAFVLRAQDIIPNDLEYFSLEENVGAVPVRLEAGKGDPLIWLTTPPIRYGQTFDRSLCATVLGLEGSELLDPLPQLVTAGNPTVFIPLVSKDAVDRAWLEVAGMKQLKGAYVEPLCAFVFAPTSEGAYSRMFSPEYGIAEDPATGSSTGPLFAYMMKHSLVANASGRRYVSEQGTKMGRRSILHVEIRGENGSDGIDVGGYVTPLVQATMRL